MHLIYTFLIYGVFTMKKFFAFTLLALMSGLTFQTAWCADAQQTFTVNVPANVSISAPVNATLTHDETDNNQVFPSQSWVVKGNVLAGVNVVFATNQPFTHATDNTFKRNAKLDLAAGAKLGPATWTVTKATDTTDYATNKLVASVTASSNGVGRSAFDLSVTFITDTFGTFAAGSYTTTVTGTVTAN